MQRKKRVLVIFTGGTIVSGFQGKGKVAGPNNKMFKSLNSYVENFFQDKNIELTCQEPLGMPGEDSSNLGPEQWIKITSIIVEELQKGIDGVLILYGTDTMAYLSSWLGICFPQVPIPVVITGSQLTLDYMPEDVTVNLRGAAQVVCSDFPGVWIYCNWKLIPGARAHKAHALHPDIFIAANGVPVYFNPDWALKNKGGKSLSKIKYFPSDEIKKILNYDLQKARNICEKISWFMCLPGAEQVLSDDRKIVCVYGFGAGNAPTRVLDYFRSFYFEKEKPCIIACSQAEGDIKKPKYYKKVGIGWLVDDGFKVWSQMDYPIEFIHALACFSLLTSSNDP
ncbi:MAG: asparaginase domain-containing protein, partial [Atribacterota bacterium]